MISYASSTFWSSFALLIMVSIWLTSSEISALNFWLFVSSTFAKFNMNDASFDYTIWELSKLNGLNSGCIWGDTMPFFCVSIILLFTTIFFFWCKVWDNLYISSSLLSSSFFSSSFCFSLLASSSSAASNIFFFFSNSKFSFGAPAFLVVTGYFLLVFVKSIFLLRELFTNKSTLLVLIIFLSFF